jgi:hypothetical protein
VLLYCLVEPGAAMSKKPQRELMIGQDRLPATCNKNSQRAMLCAATRLAASDRAAPARRIPIQPQLTEQSIVTYL